MATPPKTEIERLIQEGNLGQYVRTRNEKTHINPRGPKRAKGGEEPRESRRQPKREEKRKERSRSPQRRNTRHKGVITTISGGGGGIRAERNRKRKASDVLVVRGNADATPTLMITFGERDMRYDPSRHDKPMVISVVVAEYKVEKVLIDQGSSANILYWSTYMRMGLKPINMEPCTGKLYGFASKQVEIRGAVELETTFGEGNHTRTISILYTIVDVEASYNIIMGRSTLNKLGVVVSTYHLCMKYPMRKEVGRVWADHRVARRCYEDSLRIGSQPANRPNLNVLDFDLDLDPRLLPIEDLKEINIGPDPAHKTKIGIALMQEDESRLISFLRENRDVFAWSPADMPRVDPEFICHQLSIYPSFRPVTQRRRQLWKEKRKVAREETKKLLVASRRYNTPPGWRM
ncbi:hypothetical protein CR513_53410, partial [Mucuna pruriens]